MTTVDTVTGTAKTMVLNMGPQHPSTHGVLRILLELDGETVVKAVPDLGYLHTGIEKSCEDKTYSQAITLTDRMDYLNPLGNNLVYCLAVEKLLGLEVPKRAQYIRVMIRQAMGKISKEVPSKAEAPGISPPQREKMPGASALIGPSFEILSIAWRMMFRRWTRFRMKGRSRPKPRASFRRSARR